MSTSEAAPGGASVPAAGAAAELARRAAGLRGLADAVLAAGALDAVPDAAIQEGLTALARLYGAKCEAGTCFSPFVPEGGVTATTAMFLTSGVLQAVHVELFELGMWKAFSGA